MGPPARGRRAEPAGGVPGRGWRCRVVAGRRTGPRAGRERRRPLSDRRCGAPDREAHRRSELAARHGGHSRPVHEPVGRPGGRRPTAAADGAPIRGRASVLVTRRQADRVRRRPEAGGGGGRGATGLVSPHRRRPSREARRARGRSGLLLVVARRKARAHRARRAGLGRLGQHRALGQGGAQAAPAGRGARSHVLVCRRERPLRLRCSLSPAGRLARRGKPPLPRHRSRNVRPVPVRARRLRRTARRA